MKKPQLLVAAAALVIGCLLGRTPAAAQSAPGNEIDIKAAFLYKFGDFVQWPPQSFTTETAQFVVGVMGAEPIAAALDRLVAERKVHGRPVVVRRLHPGDTLSGVHVLFVGHAEAGHLREILARAGAEPILGVTDSEGALSAGSTINFVVEDERVRFDIALPAAERAGLKISSRLLSVARRVITS